MHRLLVIAISIFTFQFCYGQEFIFVFLNNKPDKEVLTEEKSKEIMDGHMANINRLAREGKLMAAGPFDGGGGIFIFKSGSIAEVREWLATDPGVKANRWMIEIFNYQPRHGSVCAVGEHYEMTNYFFVRYSINATKDTLGELPGTIASHQEYIKPWLARGGIAEGLLGDQEGSILILKQEPTQDLLVNDPAVKKGAMSTDVKKLFIAQGSFCEPKP